MEAKIILRRWRQPRSSRRNEDSVRTLQVYKVHLLLEAQKLKFKTRWSLVTEQSTNLVLTLQMGFNPGTVWVFTWENQEAIKRRILNERQVFADCQRGAKILSREGKKWSNQSRRTQEVNCSVEPAWSTGLCYDMTKNCALDWNYWSLRSFRLIWLVRVLLKLTPSSLDVWG